MTKKENEIPFTNIILSFWSLIIIIGLNMLPTAQRLPLKISSYDNRKLVDIVDRSEFKPIVESWDIEIRVDLSKTAIFGATILHKLDLFGQTTKSNRGEVEANELRLQ